jgi:hypothetical protein
LLVSLILICSAVENAVSSFLLHLHSLWNQCYKEGVPLPTVGYCLGTALEQDDDWIPINPDSLLTESWKTTEAKSIPSVTAAAPAAATGTTWKLGKLSVLMLLFVTFTDFALSQIQRLRSPEILPLNRYQSSGSRLGLGSAAISSVTEALSPILPFTGGVDLRREDYWTTQGSWFETLQSVAEKVQDAFSSDESAHSALWNKIPRAGGNVPGKLASQLSSNKRIKTNNVSSISAPSLFIDVKAIEDLTLKDLTETFRYAVESSKEGFNEGRFMNGQLPRVKKVLIAMQDAVNKSRGKDVKNSVVSSDDFGEIDALKFSAAMRIFAEWRIVRQVPVGYKGYAVGMSLGHKDVVQNLAKIEQSVHSWLDHQREETSRQEQSQDEGEIVCPVPSPQSELRSPTLRELLQHELETEVHPTLPLLKDKTAAMGLLWVYRQFHYQTALFVNVLNVPKRFPSTKDAVSTAYQEVYDRYHGWAVQKIFSYSFQAAPDASEIYKFMNPHRMEEVLKDAQRMKSSNSEDKVDSLPVSTNIDNAAKDTVFVGFVKHFGGEWDKFTDSVGQVLKGEKVADVDVRGGSDIGLGGAELDEMVTREMIKDAHQHITEYLNIANPLLSSLSGLFDTFNMNDPTKV